MQNLFGTGKLDKLRLIMRGMRLECPCGAFVKLKVRKFGTVLDVSGPEVQGWSFTTARGWQCPTCSKGALS